MPNLTEKLRHHQPKSVRRTMLGARVQLRRPGASARAAPDFLIIGAQRSGTTSLYGTLRAHPAVVPALAKELQYFSTAYGRGPQWYRAHFPLTATLEERRQQSGQRALTFDATPYYLFHPLAARRAAATVPNARLVALLRNPADRAYSHYRHTAARGLEPLDFQDALAAEPERLAGEAERIVAEPGYRSDAHKMHSYFSRGVYVDQLREWLRHFPRHQLLVLQSEDLYGDPGATLSRVLDFLQMPAWAPASFPVLASAPESRSGMSPGTRAALVERYAPHNQALVDLLGRPFSWDG